MNDNYNIFSLNKFRKIKDNSYNSKNECLKYSEKYGKEFQTNPRFNKFDQTYFNAGDFKDINKYGLLPVRYFYSMNNNTDIDIKNTDKDKDIKNSDIDIKNIFKLYKKIDYTSIRNTFDYMFNKFKKGVFVIIHDNKLVLFLPFSNAFYKNNWIKQTYFSEEDKRLLESDNIHKIKDKLNDNIIKFIKKHHIKNKINFNRNQWYANNCIFRNEYPSYEGELNINIIKDMIETLLKERTIPNVEFFLNDRDFPILKKDYTEPYNHLFDSDKVKIEKEYQFKKMCPIFSKSATDKYADILMPTNDDWIMASNKYFSSGCSNSYHKTSWDKINTTWDTKKSICIFRGSATGCGITLETNMRLKAADLSLDYPDLLDAAITNWKARMRKYEKMPIDIIDTTQFRFKLASSEMDNITKSNYKYILNIDGYVSAFRLSSELSMNSLVLLVKSDYKLWFSHMLEPYIHFIPIKKDLSDLISQIKWCKENDKKCKEIASNALKFHNKYLSKNGILDYLQNKLSIIHFNKNFKNLLDIKKNKKMNIAIITCFRDKGNGLRENQRKIFIQLMNILLKPYCNFKIYIIEQSDDGESFNIGKLKNIGFEIASKEHNFDNYIFSDIDTIPDYDLMEYMLKVYEYPLSLAIRGTRYTLKNIKIKKPFLGALIQFNQELFKKMNGYPNNFWGWGGEDDSLFNRLIGNDIPIVYYPLKGSIIDFEEIKMTTINNIGEKLKDEIKNMEKIEKEYDDFKNWNKNGLNSLHYKIISQKDIIENIVQIKVNLDKKYDLKHYPLWFPKQSPNYSKLMNKIKNIWDQIKVEYV